MELVFLDPKADPRYEAELDLRYRVLRKPLGMRRDQVGFEGEENAAHLVAIERGELVGCVLFDFRSGRLRAMAVDPVRQRGGIGALLVRTLEDELARRGVREVMLHARQEAAGFYGRLGYVERGEPFHEVGIPHMVMGKLLLSPLPSGGG